VSQGSNNVDGKIEIPNAQEVTEDEESKNKETKAVRATPPRKRTVPKKGLK